MIHDVLNTKMDVGMSVVTAALLLPVEQLDLLIKAIPAAVATIYWIVRLMNLDTKKKDR